LTYAAGLAISAALLVGVAGCGQPDEKPAQDGTVSVAIQPTITPWTTQTVPGRNPSAAVPGGEFDLESMLTTTSCEQSGGVWSFTGSFANTSGRDLVLSIAIALYSTADGTIVANHEVELNVPRGETVPVAAKDFYSNAALDATKVQCITGVTDKSE